VIFVGDVHGCFDTFLALKKKLPDDYLVFVGDLIDRGPKSKEMVQWVIDHKDECTSIMGNHEHVFLDMLDKTYAYSYWDWYRMGGKETMFSYDLTPDSKFTIPEEHYAYLSKMPLHIEYDACVVSHAPHGALLSFEESLKNPDWQFGCLWNRTRSRRIHGKFHIHGHNPVKEPWITEDFANIDTACVYDEGKILTALEFPSMKLFQQERLEPSVGF
jgi:serine/threonine protein phosphatase 1